MIAMLLSMNHFLSAVLVVGVVTGLSLLVTWWGVIQHSNAALKVAYTKMVPNVGVALTAGFMLFVALIVNGVLKDRSVAEEAVEAEGHALHIARGLLPRQDYPQWHAALSKYIDRVTLGEWPEMREGARSHAAHDALMDLRMLASEGFTELSPAQRAQLQEVVRAIDAARWHRLLAAVEDVPMALWMTLMVAALVAVFFSAAAHAHAPHAAYVMAILYGVVIGSMFFAILALDHPFAGMTAVSSAPIAVHALN